MSKFKQAKHLREGDRVIAIAGNDKGKSGVVLARFGERVLVQGLNIRKKAVKRSQQAPQGGMMEREMPIHVSNVMVCNEDGKPLRLKVRVNPNGERELYFKDKESGKEVLYRAIKNSKR